MSFALRRASFFSRLSDEIVTEILFCTVYHEEEFSDSLEYDTPYERQNSTRRAHSQFAANVLKVDRRFRVIGREVLWRNVILFTGSALLQVSKQSSKYGRHTRRLELRMRDWYDTNWVEIILREMPNVKVFLLRTFQRDTWSGTAVDTTSLVRALCADGMVLRRIQLDSYIQVFSQQEIFDIVQAHPKLIALRLSGFAPAPSNLVPEETALTAGGGGTMLQTLSIGVSHWAFGSVNITSAQECLLYVFTNRAKLDAMTTVHFMEFTPRAVAFLHRFGPQIRHLTITMPLIRSHASHVGEVVQHCSGLEEVVWVAKDWRKVDVLRALPAGHQSIRTARLVIYKNVYHVPSDFLALVRQLLLRLRDGAFPAMREIVVEVYGGQLPKFREYEWFRDLERGLIERGAVGDRAMRGRVILRV